MDDIYSHDPGAMRVHERLDKLEEENRVLRSELEKVTQKLQMLVKLPE